MGNSKLRTLSPHAWFNRCASCIDSIPETDIELFYLESDECLLKALATRSENFDSYIGGEKPPIMDPWYIRQLRTFYGSLKKFRDPVSGVSQSDLQNVALKRYKANNLASRANTIPRKFLGEMRRFLSEQLNGFDCDTRFVSVPRFGNGGVEEKADVVTRWISLPSQRWLDFRDPLNATPDVEDRLVDQPSTCRLHAVPKDWNKMRLITIEPYLKTYIQQTVRQELLACLFCSKAGDFRSMARCEFCGNCDPQARHRRMALQGSMDGSLATLDLRDASDMVSYEQVCSVFPPAVLAQLDRARSEYWYDPRNNETGEVYMFGGMGNACTFIVETMMFHAACHAIARYFGLKRPRVSVFGDDIVCSAELAEVIMRCRIFDDFGWHINASKSFWTANSRFRESCGIQAFNGHDVTLLRYMGGYNGPNGAFALRDLIGNARDGHCWLLSSPWPEATEIPNIPFCHCEGLCTHIEWWPDTSSALERRFNKSLQRMEVNLQFLQTQRRRLSVRGCQRNLGLVYGALSGQLSGKTPDSYPVRGSGHSRTKMKTSNPGRRSEGSIVLVDVPSVQKVVSGWSPLT